ncbi:MAG: hypothetical protein WCR27_09945, partial [Eubacteriales bacterium]
SVAQLMKSEIHLFNAETKQNIVEENARTAMNSVLDQFRLYGYVYYLSTSEYDNGLYSNDPVNGNTCILNLNPDPEGDQDSTQMYYLPDEDELWYRDTDTGNTYLITGNITTLEIQPVTSHLARINIVSEKSDYSFQLVTWARLY